MKILTLFGLTLFMALVTNRANAQSETAVDPTFNGKKIYVGSGAPDLPLDIHTVLGDLVCQAKGFASESSSTVEFVELKTPTEVAVPILGNGTPEIPELRLYTLDPKYSPSIAVLTKLSCSTKN